MPRSFDVRLERLLRALVIALSIFFVLLFLVLAARRMRFPFELDRLEDPMLTSVWRLRHGEPLYCAPSFQWAPFLYAPLFFYVGSAVSKVVGVNYAALRLVSILSTLGSMGAIFALVWSETRRWAACAFAVGIFASLYAFVYAWYDIGRVDSLALLLFLLAILATRRTHPVLAAFLWLLTFLAKQTYLPLGIAMFLIEWRRPRRMLLGMFSFAALAAAAVFWLNRSSHGWFSYFAFGTAGVIGWSTHMAVLYPFADLIGPLPIAAGLILAAALFTDVRWRERQGSYFAIVTVLLLVAVGYVRAHVGANLNAVIPAYAWIAVLAGIAVHRILLRVEETSPGATTYAPVAATVWLFAGVQLLAHLYRPAEIPKPNLASRQQFMAALRATPGDVWVVDHSFDGLLAGKPLHPDMDAFDAVLARGYAPAVDEFRRAVENRQMTAVVLDRDPAGYHPEGIFTAPPFSSVYRMRVSAPGAGEPDQPQTVLLPCDTGNGPPGSLLDLRGAVVDRSQCPSP